LQEVWVGNGEAARMLTLPGPEEELVPGVRWGSAASPQSPAYWVARCSWPDEEKPNFVTRDGSLAEELGFCLLGGFGIRYEVNAAAFERLKDFGVFVLNNSVDEVEIEALLLEPLRVGSRSIRYRFPTQRARRISKMRDALRSGHVAQSDPIDLRKNLMKLEGVGPKTASWVVRNLLGCDRVAILDVHIVRVCQRFGLFPREVSLPRDYHLLEERFLSFADSAGVSSAALDAIMWAEARTVPAEVWQLT